MFILDKSTNKICNIASKSFQELGFKEREHLQEWIAKSPECLGEELLIIQKEFDGFNDTNERLDLLAIDKEGSIVVIENKLDDSGKDVTWQALKYISYCSTLTKQQVKEIYQEYLDRTESEVNAEDKISEFMNNKPFSEISLNSKDQRMILVAAKFRKEVTSTVMWLLNHNIRVQCLKATPYIYGSDVLLDIEQIIPVKEAQEYMIKMADKDREVKEVEEKNKDIEALRKEFWKELLLKFNEISGMFKNVNPTTDHWLSCGGTGVGGIRYDFVITKSYVATELLIDRKNQEDCKQIFDKLYENKSKIEADFGKELIWERLSDKKASRITNKLFEVDITDQEDWGKIITFLIDSMPRLEKTLKDQIKKAVPK